MLRLRLRSDTENRLASGKKGVNHLAGRYFPTTCPGLRAREKRKQKYIRGRIIFDPVFLE